MSVPGILSQIADEYGLTVKTVTRRIRENPELGIKIEARRTPVLTENQVQEVCAMLDRQYGRRVKVPTAENLKTAHDEAEYSAVAAENSQLSQKIEGLTQTVSELKSKNAQLTTDLAVEKAKRDGVEAQLALVLELNQQIPKLNEAAEARAAEIDGLRQEIAQARAELAETQAKQEVELLAARDEWKSKGFWDRVLRR